MKRNNFLKLGIGIPLLGMFSFKSFPKKCIKENPVIIFTSKNLSEFNSGTYIIRHTNKSKYRTNVMHRPDYAATVTWKLVYQMGYAINNIKGEKIKIKFPKYGLCNVLTDGWTYWVGSKEELCNYLNNNPYGNTYRVLTKEELYYIIENRTNQKQIVRHI